MSDWLDKSQAPLTAIVGKTLKTHAAQNRSGLPPFALPKVAQRVVSCLIGYFATSVDSEPRALGLEIGRQGLARAGALALGRVLVADILVRRPGDLDAVLTVQTFLAQLVDGVAQSEMDALVRQRDEMQASLERAIQSREIELRRAIWELSTPLMPVHDQILALPLIGQIDDERAQRITEQLLLTVTERRTRTTIIDITGVPSVDAQVAAGIVRAAKAVQLLGAAVILCGIRPEIARTLARLDVDLTGLTMVASLKEGIELALRERGLVVSRVASQPGAAPRALNLKTERRL